MRLIEWMEREGVTAEALAQKIGVSRQTAYNLAREKGTPTLFIAAMVEAVTGGAVGMLSHLSPAEKKRLWRLKDEAASTPKRGDNGEAAGASGSSRDGDGRGEGD